VVAAVIFAKLLHAKNFTQKCEGAKKICLSYQSDYSGRDHSTIKKDVNGTPHFRFAT
jgi:hypothetical protein